jgi:hypothetical protein
METIHYNPAEGCRVEWREGRDMSVDVMSVDIDRAGVAQDGLEWWRVSIGKWGSDHHSGPLLVGDGSDLKAEANIGPYELNAYFDSDPWAVLRNTETGQRWAVRLVESKDVSKWVIYAIDIDEPTA